MAKHRNINKEFFREWSAEMAYVLGFFAADGSMYINPRGSHYFAFYSNDYEILEKIKRVISSNNKISSRKISVSCPNQRYVIQIGSKKIYNDLLVLGLTPNKSKSLQFPDVPALYLRDFVRGYFDGDGNILFKEYFRKDRQKYKYYFATKFISGSHGFLETLRSKLLEYAGIGRGSFFKGTRSFVLSFAMKDSRRLCAFMYNDIENELYLERKYQVYKQAIDNTER